MANENTPNTTEAEEQDIKSAAELLSMSEAERKVYLKTLPPEKQADAYMSMNEETRKLSYDEYVEKEYISLGFLLKDHNKRIDRLESGQNTNNRSIEHILSNLGDPNDLEDKLVRVILDLQERIEELESQIEGGDDE